MVREQLTCYREDIRENIPVQTQIKDHMHWSDAVRSGLLFCGVCGEQIEQGCFMNSDGDIMCDDCEEE